MNVGAEMPDEPDLAGVAARPLRAEQRLVALDFIRGIAVVAILFPNVVAYGHPLLAYYWPDGLPGGATAFDRGVWLFQLVAIDGKFRGLFTLLFGAGLVLFMERVRARGGTQGLQMRRLAWLALFGLAHTFLVWPGDILFLYALSGFAALAMLEWEARKQLSVGIAWCLGGTLMLSLLFAGRAATEGNVGLREARTEAYQQVRREVVSALEEAAEEVEVVRKGGYREIVEYRLAEKGPDLPEETLIFALFETLPLMLIGMALYRMGLFDGRLDLSRWRRWAWIGVIGGLVLTLPLGLWVLNAGQPLMLTELVFSGLSGFLHLPIVLGLTVLLASWAPVASRGWLGRRFTAAGRMAFSNYLGTSLVMMLVFHGWAGGLFGALHRAGLLVVVVLGWSLMLAWSHLWLMRFRYGPLEWLWRCLTYGRVFPLRR